MPKATMKTKAPVPRVKSAVKAAKPEVRVVRQSQPRQKVKTEDVLDKRHTQITYGEGRHTNPFSTFFGKLVSNPDVVVRTNGGYDDVAMYKGMWRRHPWLEGICDQRVERANRPRSIVAGDPSDGRSSQIAADVRRLWESIPEKPTVTARWLKYARFLGYSGIEKVFLRDVGTGLIYPAKLIVRESENIKFRHDGTAVWLSRFSPFDGEPIPNRKMMFLRGGTNDTLYGHSELQSVYPATYWLENCIELAFDSIEEFGRPVPMLHMPRSTDILKPEEREKIRKWARDFSRNYLEVPTDEPRFHAEMLGANVVTSGAVGRPELSLVELCITWSYIRIMRVTQTRDKTGGSRALEDVRDDISDGAARPDSMLVDDGLNAKLVEPTDYTGWMADVCDINFPNEPTEILPRFESPVMTLDEIAVMHDMAMDLIDRDEFPSKSWYYKMTGIDESRDENDEFGVPLTRITRTEVDQLDEPNTGAPADEAPAAAHARGGVHTRLVARRRARQGRMSE